VVLEKNEMFENQYWQKYIIVSRARLLGSGRPVLTEWLVPEGCWYRLRAGHLRIDIQDFIPSSLE
jgi:hypothetical protein